MADVSNPPTVRLRRSLTARLFGPDYLQWLLWAYIGLAVLALAVARPIARPAGAPILVAGAIALAAVLWSATGGATVDEDGLRWRLRIPARASWADLTKIELAAVAHGRFYFGATTRLTPATLVIRVHWSAGDRIVAAAVSPGRGHLVDFVGAVAAQARAHGVPIEVSGAGWNAALAHAAPELLGDAAAATPTAPPPGPPPGRMAGRMAAHRLAMTGAVLLVIGGLALAGAITGWDAHGTAGRVVLSIVAAVFLLNGALLLRPLRPRFTAARASTQALVLTRRGGGTTTIAWHELTSVRLQPVGRGAAPRAYLLDLSGDETFGRRHPRLGRTARSPGDGSTRTIIALDGSTGSALASQLPRFAGQRYES
jgi:hypothetical protein